MTYGNLLHLETVCFLSRNYGLKRVNILVGEKAIQPKDELLVKLTPQKPIIHRCHRGFDVLSMNE